MNSIVCPDTTPFPSGSTLFLGLLVAASMVACGQDYEPNADTSAPGSALTGEASEIPLDVAELQPTTCPAGTEALDCHRTLIVGPWIGTMGGSGGRPSYSIEIEFGDDETYVARCPLFGDSGPGLCLEEDGVKKARAYQVTSIEANGAASGRIEAPNQESWSFITDLRFSEDGNRMTFELWSPWNGEEVRSTRYELSRTP